MKDKFDELAKVHRLLVELNSEYVMAPLKVGQTVLQMINDLHQDKGALYGINRMDYA